MPIDTAIALDQVALLCLTRRLHGTWMRRADEIQARRGQTRALKQRIARICRLGRIGGWVLDVESGQPLWTEEPPSTLGLKAQPAGGLLSLDEGPGRERLSQALSRAIAERQPLEIEHPIRVGDQERWLRFRGELEPGAGAAGRVLRIVQDITTLRRADERIQQLAHYDSLTGLPNRALFADRLAASLRWARRAGNRADRDDREPVGKGHEPQPCAGAGELPGEPAHGDALHPQAVEVGAVAGGVELDIGGGERLRDRPPPRIARRVPAAPAAGATGGAMGRPARRRRRR